MGINKQKIIQAIEAQLAVADEIGSDFITLTKGKGKDILRILKKQKPVNQDRERAITHLMIVHTWAAFALEKDLNFFEEAHMKNIVAWTEDAIDFLEQNDSQVKQEG